MEVGFGDTGFREGSLLVRIIDGVGKYHGKLWLRSVSDLDSAKLPSQVKDKLREFWESGRQIQSLELSSDARVVVEQIGERRGLFVFGAGHVGRSIALMGCMLGLDVTLLDDRHEFLAQADTLNWGIRSILVDFNNVSKHLSLNSSAAVVIVTRGHQCDEVILKQVAEFNAAYIGMIGSRRRVMGVFQRLREVGISQDFIDSVKAPIGLDIGARSPQEIAVAVHAEIIKHFSEV
jgi:xanthine dehydrogenase accessory factor